MANFNLDLGGACEKIVAQAKDYAKKNYPGPGGLGRVNGVLDMLTSPANGGVASSLITSGGKIRKARVLYKQRTKSCEISTGSAGLNRSLCDNPKQQDVKEVIISVTRRVATQPREFTNERMAVICQDVQPFVDEYLMSDQRALREALNYQMGALVAAHGGKNIQQSGTTVAPGVYTDKKVIVADTNGQFIPLTGNYNDMLMDYQNMEFSGIPYFIGQGNLQTFFKLARFACCNQSTPYASAIADAGGAFFLDQQANTYLGASNRILMGAFGVEQLLIFNENANINLDTNIFKHIVIPDPVYPQIKWDLDFKWDECAKAWLYMQSAYYDLFNVIQADSFNVDTTNSPGECNDELQGVLGVWTYRATSS